MYSIAAVWLFMKLGRCGVFELKFVNKPAIKKLQTNKTFITQWSWKLKLLNTKEEHCQEKKQKQENTIKQEYICISGL